VRATTPSLSNLAAALAAALVLAACGSDATPRGEVRVVAARAALGEGAARAAVTVSAGDGPAFPDIVAPLVEDADEFHLFLSGIPAGSGRRFEIQAWDEGGALVARGVGQADVDPGATAAVAVLVNPASVLAQAAAMTATVPVLDLLGASATSARPGGTVTLQVSAHDPGGGDLTYRWTTTCGAFDDPARPAVTWTAPQAAGTCDVGLTVASGGSSVQVGVAIDVGPP
jgi:hypothetical protein